MISSLVSAHIRRKAKKNNIRYLVDVDAQLEKVIKTIDLHENKIVFSWLFDAGSKTLNACALIPRIIIVNSEWAAHLALYRTEDVQNAFKVTLGHELTHKDNDFVFWEYFTRDKKFVNWVNEVHADFGAIKKLNSNRDDLINALKYKRRCKGTGDKSSSSHPSWEQRIQYVEQFYFDEGLIRRIASDVGCTNDKLIINVCNHYEK